MNSTTETAGRKFPFGSGPNAMDNKTLVATLAASTIAALLFTLVLYAVLSGHSPLPRVSYGVFVSLLPALGAYIVLRLTNIFISRRGAVFVYFAFFVLVVIVHGFTWLLQVA